MKKFVMLDSQEYPDQDLHQEKEIISKAGYEVSICRCESQEDAVEAARGAEVIGDAYIRIDDALLEKLPDLKCVARYGIGYDPIDVDACTRHGVFACNLPTYCLDDVAQIAVGLILDLARKITMFDRDCRRGNWNLGIGYTPHRMSYYTIGLCGFGNIARHVWELLKPFGVKGIAYDAYLPAEVFAQSGIRQVDFETLLRESDILSVHVPATPETHHMFNDETIGRMKEGAMLVNTARGAIVSNEAVVRALKSAHLAAAALDVNEDEPIHDRNHPLYSCETAVVLPHTAFNTFEAADAMHVQVAQIAVAAMNGTLTSDPEMQKHIVREQRAHIREILERQAARG